jgi:hypothetical protein
MRVVAPILLVAIAGCGPDLLIPFPACCEDNEPRPVHPRDMEDGQLLAVLAKPDRTDLSACWREAERRRLIRLMPPRDGKHARLIHDEDVSQEVIERYLTFKRSETRQDVSP